MRTVARSKAPISRDTRLPVQASGLTARSARSVSTACMFSSRGTSSFTFVARPSFSKSRTTSPSPVSAAFTARIFTFSLSTRTKLSLRGSPPAGSASKSSAISGEANSQPNRVTSGRSHPPTWLVTA